jgi:CRISPR/Cas system-associated protein endoribonuclease Cas2
MKRKNLTTLILAIAAVMMVVTVSPVLSQDKQADNMKILLDKVKADKKLLVAANMGLTEAEAKGFWPVYEAYQKGLMAINKRIGGLIVSYAEAYQGNTLTDEKAKKLTAEYVNIQKAEADLQASFVPKLSKVLPPKMVLRYLQIENKIRAVVKYELAAEIPLVD